MNNQCNINNRSMARFSDINRADELKAAAIKLAAWRSLDATAKRAAYATATAIGGGKRANRASQIGFIQPFGDAAKLWIETKILAPPSVTPSPGTSEETVSTLITSVLTAVNPGISLALPDGAGNISVAVKKVQLAKVRLTEKTGAGIPGTVSRMTGFPYTKYNSNTISCPYGKGGTFTGEAVARGLLRAALLGTTPNGKSVGFTPQGDVKTGVKP